MHERGELYKIVFANVLVDDAMQFSVQCNGLHRILLAVVVSAKILVYPSTVVWSCSAVWSWYGVVVLGMVWLCCIM